MNRTAKRKLVRIRIHMGIAEDILRARRIALKRRIKELIEQSMTLVEARARARIEMGEGLLEARVSYVFCRLRHPSDRSCDLSRERI